MDISPLREKLVAERDLDIGLLAPDAVERGVRARMERAQQPDLDSYVRHLDSSPEEYDDLVRDLVAPPEVFFGDAELTALLEKRILASIVKHKEPGSSIRIWVVNCGRGHLVYDIALLLSELLGDSLTDYAVKVIGTDPDARAIAAARKRAYPSESLSRVESRKRLAGHGSEALQEAQGVMVFGVHDPILHHSYSRLDLVVCRGYFPLLSKDQRSRLLAKLMHSLITDGVLVIGRGELIGLGGKPPTQHQPFSVLTKRLAHAPELFARRAGEGRDGATPLNRLRVPALAVDSTGALLDVNQAAESALGLVVGTDTSAAEPGSLAQSIFEAVTHAASQEAAVSFSHPDGWVGAAAPLAVEPQAPRSVVVVLTAIEAEEETAPSPMERLAIETAESTAGLWSYNAEAQQFRSQASALSQSLYLHAEEHSRIRDELESRNAELEIANQELAQAIIERESAEQQVRMAFEREHRIAQTLQQALLPPVIEQAGDTELAVRYEAAWQEADVGGDFYHTAHIPGDRLMVALGDVSGKGLDAAVYASMAKYMMLGFASENSAPDVVLSRLNDALFGYSDQGFFVTLVCMVLDVGSHRVFYGNAGHELVIHLSHQTGETTLLQPTGRALGFMPDAEFVPQTLEMLPGDMLLAYTDGLSEAGYRTLSSLGTEGIERILKDNADAEPSEILDVLHDTATALSGGRLSDDAASVLIRRRG